MAETVVRAIVLRRRDSGESDRRLTLFSAELGKIEAIAKGARKAASRLAGASEPLSISTFALAVGRNRRFITQAQPHTAHPRLRTDYDRLTYALAVAEFAAAVLPWEEPLPSAFEELERALGALESGPALPALVWALLRIVDVSGFAPSFLACADTGAALAEREAYFSPAAGGHVSAASAAAYPDRIRVRAEALIGLARTMELAEPPARLGHASACLNLLAAYCLAVAESPLPALASAAAAAAEAERSAKGAGPRE